jgi:hypothetical protein
MRRAFMIHFHLLIKNNLTHDTKEKGEREKILRPRKWLSQKHFKTHHKTSLKQDSLR